MKRVYIASDMMDAELFKDYLLNLGVPAFVKDAMLTGIIGEIPANTYPTVWVEDDRDYTLARKSVALYEQKITDKMAGEPWICVQCGEKLGPQFSQCWSCGKEKQGD